MEECCFKIKFDQNDINNLDKWSKKVACFGIEIDQNKF